MFRRHTILISLLLAAVTAIILGCTPSAQKKGDLSDRQIEIVTTIGQLRDAAQNIGGDRVNVQALMGPGVDPHLYSATGGDIERLESADLIIYNGLELEGRMGEIFESLSDQPTLAAADVVPHDQLRASAQYADKFDPHIWFDPDLWIQAVEAIKDSLVELDPESSDLYEANFAAYKDEISTLDQESTAMIEEIPENQRILVTAHDAFGYFGAHFGLEVEAIQGLSTATEASAIEISRLSTMITDRKIKAIFIESSISPATITALQKSVKDKGWTVEIGGELFSDAMGDAGTAEDTYIGMFRHNVITISEALK
jgi:manganese/zinc/iron transport system substrate-binding protein